VVGSFPFEGDARALRHADPSVTLRHYQKSIPSSIRAAAEALETELMSGNSRERIEQVAFRERKVTPLKFWSHPPGSNRRPADYESLDV
jgi:hypothetical protein